jgi:AraC family transcriptional regulator of adaptative response / DNA-3-methyladenine glycosylase II
MPSNPSSVVVVLHVRDAFDWLTLRSYLAGRSIPGMEHVGPSSYVRSVVVNGRPTVIEVRSNQAGDVELVLRGAQRDDHDALVSLARRALSLDAHEADDDARELFRHDRDLAPLVAARPNLRVPGTWDGFETGVRAIVGQQVSVAGATTITARIAHRHGMAIAPSGTDHERTGGATIVRCFPRPESLAEGDLTRLGLTNARMATIHGFAQGVADGTLRLDADRPLDEFVAAITARRGLGPWTAHYLALRLGYRDAFPSGDLALRRALDRENPPSPRKLLERAERWRPWRSLAAAHLWAADALRAPAAPRRGVRPRGHEPTGPRGPRSV